MVLALAPAPRELGVHVALDDFGTGYSSPPTSGGCRSPPSRSTVRSSSTRPNDLAITASIADLGRAIGLRTVAEGVETTAQLATPVQLGCAAGQGYLWSPALPLEDLVALLAEHPTGFGPPPPPAIAPAALSGIRPMHRPVTAEHGLLRLPDLHRAGASLATIAAALNAEGYRRPTGVRWHPTTVARAVAVHAFDADTRSATRSAPPAQ